MSFFLLSFSWSGMDCLWIRFNRSPLLWSFLPVYAGVSAFPDCKMHIHSTTQSF